MSLCASWLTLGTTYLFLQESVFEKFDLMEFVRQTEHQPLAGVGQITQSTHWTKRRTVTTMCLDRTFYFFSAMTLKNDKLKTRSTPRLKHITSPWKNKKSIMIAALRSVRQYFTTLTRFRLRAANSNSGPQYSTFFFGK